MNIPKTVVLALDLLNDAGFEAYVVGGCVRDSLLNIEPNDWDITTIALPDEIKKVFEGYKVIETGIKHGTVTVVIEDMILEITTYRVDGEYLDNRHPMDVTFSRILKEDLARRDFTINALACNTQGIIVDEFNGIEDLDNKLIRCVGNPDLRFNEDALRIMRALRFASTLGFDIDIETGKSIHKNAELLKNIAWERITEELLKLLCGNSVKKVLIEYRDVFAVIIPELEPCFDFDQKNEHHIYDVYEHIAVSVSSAKALPEIRLAMLLHDIAKPNTFVVGNDGAGHFPLHPEQSAETAKDILKRLKVSNDLLDTVYNLVLYHYYPIENNRVVLRKAINKFGIELFEKLMFVKIADNDAHNCSERDFHNELEECLSLAKEIASDKKECFSLNSLQINGTDLLELGLFGPEIGNSLEKLLDEVMEEKIENDKQKLLERVKEIGTSKA